MQLTGYLQWLGRRVSNGVTIGLAIVVSTIIFSTQAFQKEAETESAVNNAASIAGPVAQLCARGDDLAAMLRTARTPDGRAVCDQANVVLAFPTAVAVATVSDSHILALIRAEIAKQPTSVRQSPSLDQLTAAVRNVMRDNPVLFKGERGDPGMSPSSAEITQAVAAYIRANPNQFRGLPGEDGKDGRNGSNGSTATVTETPPTTTVTRDPDPREGVTETYIPSPEVTSTPTAPPTASDQGPLSGLPSP